MKEHVNENGIHTTLGQLGTSDYSGWLTDVSSGERRWCVLFDLVFCLFASDNEKELPVKTVLLPGLRVTRLLFASALQCNSHNGASPGNHSLNGLNTSGLPRHQFVISDPGNGKLDVFGSRSLRHITEWICNLELAVAQPTDMSQPMIGVGFRNDGSDVPDYLPSACTRLVKVDGCNNELLNCIINPTEPDDYCKRDKQQNGMLRHTNSSPPKCNRKSVFRTPSCPTATLRHDDSHNGNLSKDETAHRKSRKPHSLLIQSHTRWYDLEGVDCSAGDASIEDQPKCNTALRRALSLSGLLSPTTRTNNPYSKMKQFVRGFTSKRRRATSERSLVECPADDLKQAWSLEDTVDPRTASIGGSTIPDFTAFLGSDCCRCGNRRMKTARSEPTLNYDDKPRRPQQRLACQRYATLDSRVHEHRTKGSLKSVSFFTDDSFDAIAATIVETANQKVVSNTHRHSEATEKCSRDARITCQCQSGSGSVRRRKNGFVRKPDIKGVFDLLRCSSGRRKDLGVTNCIGRQLAPPLSPLPEKRSSLWYADDNKPQNDINDDRSALSKKTGQRSVRHTELMHTPVTCGSSFLATSVSILIQYGVIHVPPFCISI